MRIWLAVETAPRFGVLACLADLVHLHRWGTLPVVGIAQGEKEVYSVPEQIAGTVEMLE